MAATRVLLWVGALVAASGLGLGWLGAAPAAPSGKPDLGVRNVVLAGLTPTANAHGRLRVKLTPAMATKQHSGVCVFPWKVALERRGLPDPDTLVAHEVWIGDKALRFDRPRKLGIATALDGVMSMKPGKHVFRVALDVHRKLAESDEVNNAVEVEVELSGSCKAELPTYSPAAHSKYAAMKATPKQVVQQATDGVAWHAVPKLKLARKISDADDGYRALLEAKKVPTFSEVEGPPPRRLQLRSISYFHPTLPMRPTHALDNWRMDLPDYTMEPGESVVMRFKWALGEGEAPPLAELEGSLSGIGVFGGTASNVSVHYDQATAELRVMMHNAVLSPDSAWPKSASVLLKHDDHFHLSNPVNVYRGDTYDFYDETLARVFTHERCTSCHSVGSRTAINDYHRAREVPSPNGEPQDAEFCTGCCHTFEFMEDWRSPAFSQGLDFSQMNAKEICQTMTANLQGDALWTHFRDDPRIHWAVNNGYVPMARPRKEVLFPEEYGVDEFLELVAMWIYRAGARCE